MQLLPVVQRELLVAARRRGTYLSRTLSAGVLLAFFTSLLSVNRSLPAFGGAHILQFLSTIVFFECMIAGIRYTSDCLSEEKREGTLGLLFLTNLSGFDVVLGKMIARSVGALFNLVAVIPILALTTLVGGVVGAQIFTISIILVVSTLFSLCVGAFVSSRGFRERGVLVGTLVFLLILTFLPLGLHDFGVWLNNLAPAPRPGFKPSEMIDQRLVQAVQFFSPLYGFREAVRGFGGGFQSACWTLLTMSVVMIGYASWRIRHAFGEPERIAPKERNAPLTAKRLSSDWALTRNPVLWLALRARTSRARVFLFCSGALIFGLFARISLESKWNWAPPVILLTTYGFHLLYKFLITAETVRQINEDKRSGALELLLTTPIQQSQFIRGHVAATRTAWLPAAISVAIMNVFWMTEDSFSREVGILLPCSVLILFFDTMTLTRRAVLNALRGERYSLTVFKTFFRVIVPPIAVIVMVLTLRIGTPTSKETMQFIFGMWTIACVIYDFVLIEDARIRLKNLRALASGDERNRRFLRVFRPLSLSVAPSRGVGSVARPA